MNLKQMYKCDAVKTVSVIVNFFDWIEQHCHNGVRSGARGPF